MEARILSNIVGEDMKVYVIMKVALQELGEFSMGSIEKIFDTQAKAEAYVKGKNAIWTENNQGVNYYCERSITESEVE
jgi:hypothetical protein